jgi:hypothetical protein
MRQISKPLSATAGAIQTLSVVSRSSCAASCPCGASARKKWVSKRLGQDLQVIQCAQCSSASVISVSPSRHDLVERDLLALELHAVAGETFSLHAGEVEWLVATARQQDASLSKHSRIAAARKPVPRAVGLVLCGSPHAGFECTIFLLDRAAGKDKDIGREVALDAAAP